LTSCVMIVWARNKGAPETANRSANAQVHNTRPRLVWLDGMCPPHVSKGEQGVVFYHPTLKNF
jgi:hypothetical protein